jgi:hypothetical protein
MHLQNYGKLASPLLSCVLALSIGAAPGTNAGAASQSVAEERSARLASRPVAREARANLYEAKRETVLEGTVVSYTENSQRAPTGAHVMLRTASSSVDVHLGPATYLQSRHFSLAAGESVRFAGVSVLVNGASVFLARTAQKGNQFITIRSPRGSLLANGAVRILPAAERAQIKQQGGAR